MDDENKSTSEFTQERAIAFYYIKNNIWHLHSLSIDESKCYGRIFECVEDILYIAKTKPGPVAKNATTRPSDWEWNPRPLNY